MVGICTIIPGVGKHHLSRIATCSYCNSPVYRKRLLAHFRDDCPTVPPLQTGQRICSICQKVKNQATDFYPDDGKRGHSVLSRCIQCCRDYYYLRKQSRLETGETRKESGFVKPGGWILRPCPYCEELFSFNQLVHHRPRCPKHPHPRKVQETTSNSLIHKAHGLKPKPIDAKISWTRENNLRYFYGIDTAEFDRMAAAQNGLCAMCGNPPSGNGNNRFLHVDHDHATGKVRALLCHFCNQGLGSFRDDPGLILRAIEYLARHSKLREVS